MLTGTSKRLISAFLSILLLLTLFPVSAFAATEVASGYCGGEVDGTNLTWTLDSDGVLTISGNGKMADYATGTSQPWYPHEIVEVKIGSGATSIGDCAFDNCFSLTSITIPDSVIDIGICAFCYCTSLTDITLPNGLTSIGGGAFDACGITSIVLPESMTVIGEGAFCGSSSLANIVIPSSITSVGNSAFGSCSSLTSITIPNSVTSIGDSAFEGCRNLTNITLSDKITRIGERTFYNCDKLEKIVLPNSVTSVGDAAFYECDSLKSVTMSTAVTDIGSSAFYACRNLTSITLPVGVASIGEYAFANCDSLTRITIPYSVESIGEKAFISCDSLESIAVDERNRFYSCDTCGALFNKEQTKMICYPSGNSRTVYHIPERVTSIENSAFCECINLMSVTIPEHVTSIGDSAFSRCSELTGISLPNRVTDIGEFAFELCRHLSNITIPSSVERIRRCAFSDCESLSDVYYVGSEAQWRILKEDIYYGNDDLLLADIHFGISGALHSSPYYSFDAAAGVRYGVFEYKTAKPLKAADLSYSGKHLEISLDGYEPVDIPNCTIDSKRCGTFALVPTSLNSHISAVHCNGKDALVNEVKILNTAKSFDIYVYGSGTKYQLFSDYPSLFDGNKLAESADGHFSVNPASLTKGKMLYVRAVTADGKTGKVIKTNICVKEAFNSSTKLTNKFSFTVPDDVPLLGGSDFSIDIAGLCPVSYTQEGNTIRFGLGCKESLLPKEQDDKDEQNWLNFKKAVDKMCDGWDKGDAMYGFAKKWGAKVSSSSSKFNTEFYGYCEVNLADDGGVSSWGGRLAMVVSGGWEGQWQTVVVAVPVVFKFSAEASLGAGFSIGLDLEHASLYMDGEATLILPKVRASGGVGIAYVADVSVYGSGENKIKYTTSKQGQRVTGTLSGEIGVGLSALCFSYDIPLLSGDWEYLNTGLFKGQSIRSTSEITESVLNGDNYSLDRSYIDMQSGWYTEQPKKVRLMSSGSNGASETTVQSSVYYSADPQLVITDDGTRVMVWTADIPSRSTGNHLAAVYSVYDENSGTWSEPVIVDDDGTLDANVTAATYGNKVYMAWSDANRSDFTDETTMTDMAAALEISAAVYDTETGNISVSCLTANANADLRPMLSADENGIYVTWVENSNADLLQMSGTNNILYSAFDGSVWSAPATFASLDKPVIGLDIGTLDEGVNIAYTVDTDGSLATTEDVELFCGSVGSSASALTDNESMKQNPQFVDWLGAPALAWYGAESICVYDGNNTTAYDAADTGISAEFMVENGRILSVQHSDDGSMLYSSDILDGEIGKPVAITNNADYIASFSAESFGSMTYVAFTRRSAVIGEESITESTDLCIAEIEGFHDLALLGAEVDETDVVAAATVPVTLTVKNNGLFDESGVLVTGTLDGVEKVSAICDTSIAKGDTAAITVQLPLESVITPKTEYVFSVAPVDAEDRNAEDNEGSLVLGYADLQLTAELIGSGDHKIALIDVENLSGIDTNAILHIYDDDEERTQLAAYDIGTIKAGTWELYEIDSSLLPQLRETSRNLYFTVEAAEEENLTGDNSAFLYLQSEPKDLTITVSVNGEETDFLCGASGMSQIAVAIYDEAGKMISLKAVGYSEDCEEVTVTFTDTAIPQDCHVKVFLLDKNWTPVTAALVVASATL